MATEQLENITGRDLSQVPADSELFAGEIHRELSMSEAFVAGNQQSPSENEFFAGDEDFYRQLAGFAADTGTGPAPQPGYKTSSKLQKFLVVAIAVIAAMLLYPLLRTKSTTPKPRPMPTGQVKPTPAIETAAGDQAAPSETAWLQAKPSPEIQQAQALSLNIAEQLYKQKQYTAALDTYKQLLQNTADPQQEAVRDFIKLRIAFCSSRTASVEQTAPLFRLLTQSRCPLVCLLANYQLSLIELEQKQFLNAQTKAYQTLCLIAAADFSRDFAQALLVNCHFIAAQSLTSNVLALSNADQDLPQSMWSLQYQLPDPFADLTQDDILPILNTGFEKLNNAAFRPQIRAFQQPGDLLRWSAICLRSPIEEVLARLTADIDLDLQWALGVSADTSQQTDSARQRPVTLYMTDTTSQQAIAAAAGAAGLLTLLENKNITVLDPANYTSLNQQIALLGQQALTLWQRFTLTFYNDTRIDTAHFAVALLHTQRNEIAQAIAEYNLVANRFSKSALAPVALLNSGKLKTDLRDYLGAREDLKQLVEQYPDSELADNACLYLADATQKASLWPQAVKAYGKVYNLGFSSVSKTAAALGAGQCCFNEKNYEEAVKWLDRYLELLDDHTSTDAFTAYSLLGQAHLALGNLEHACSALRNALQAKVSRDGYAETVCSLARAHIGQDNLIEALDALEGATVDQMSLPELMRILLLKSVVFRRMGLVNKAVTTLSDRAEYIDDPKLKTEVFLELARCYAAEGRFEDAADTLTEILLFAQQEPVVQTVALELAGVYFQLGRNPEVLSICRRVLQSDPAEQLKQQALELMAKAYDGQNNYEHAALALLGKWDPGRKQPVTEN